VPKWRLYCDAAPLSAHRTAPDWLALVEGRGTGVRGHGYLKMSPFFMLRPSFSTAVLQVR
jgi:hypothetical protein